MKWGWEQPSFKKTIQIRRLRGEMADREGFEPSNGFHRYTLSRRAPSTTRPPVLPGRVGNTRPGRPRQALQKRQHLRRSGLLETCSRHVPRPPDARIAWPLPRAQNRLSPILPDPRTALPTFQACAFVRTCACASGVRCFRGSTGPAHAPQLTRAATYPAREKGDYTVSAMAASWPGTVMASHGGRGESSRDYAHR